ncbi:hypothetical protein C1H46_044164 [Malus baccata]|uniref:Uncharacterized protein n=1 Tax=Malus baccata TaxID=106549 RepID=A0A540K7T8_MALBA|nr:hypothetical protein C1H46_044164 [Malus baccata]
MRPINSYEMNTATNSESYATEGTLPRQFADHEHVNVAAQTEDEDREALDGLRGFISELREKVPAKLADQLLKVDGKKSSVTVQKGATHGLQGSVQELSNKLERFKIRTLDFGGAVKEEDKQ